MNYPKRLIEVDLPIKRISAHARRERWTSMSVFLFLSARVYFALKGEITGRIERHLCW